MSSVLKKADKLNLSLSVPKSAIYNKAALVPVIAWRQTGNKPLPEAMMTQFTDTYMRH